MIYLILSILCSVSVSILLKMSRQWQLNLAQMIGVNYLVAITFTLIWLKPQFNQWQNTLLSQVWLFGALGILLPSVFVIMGKAAQNTGIARADTAQRLSLFLPILASFTLFNETPTIARILGIILAFIALICLLKKPHQQEIQNDLKHTIPWLLGVWLGYGTIDILFKQLSKTTGIGTNLLMMFVIAAIFIVRQFKFWKYFVLYSRTSNIQPKSHTGIYKHEYGCYYTRCIIRHMDI